MEITLRARNLPVTDSLRTYIEKRLAKLDRLLGADTAAQVTLTLERGRHVVEVTIPLDGYILRGEEETGDMYSAVDLVLEKLERQIEKYKTKLVKRIKSGSLREWVDAHPAAGPEEEFEPQVLRTKRFALKPMPLEEAILQMNLIGHSFFVFANAETEEVNVVYRRRDGNYGLMEPDR